VEKPSNLRAYNIAYGMAETVLSRYKSRRTSKEARIDAVCILGLQIGTQLIEASVPNANPADQVEGLLTVAKLSKVLQDSRRGNWDSMVNYFKEQGRDRIEEAVWRTNEFSSSENERVAEEEERKSQLMFNLAASI